MLIASIRSVLYYRVESFRRELILFSNPHPNRALWMPREPSREGTSVVKLEWYVTNEMNSKKWFPGTSDSPRPQTAGVNGLQEVGSYVDSPLLNRRHEFR